MDVVNNAHLNRFETEVEGGIGFLRYRLEIDTMSLLYVEVPYQARGHGIAAELTRTALEFAKERRLRVVPVCSYVVAYLRRHPDDSDMIESS